MTLQSNEERIFDLIDHLDRDLLDRATKTHFPVQLPLAFPTPLHHVNLHTVLHLVYTTLSHARHALYFAETRSNSHETAIRGVMGLFLAADESWGPDNYLSAKAWKAGSLNEERVAEFFGLEVMRETDHPSMPVKIGERWKPGVDLAGDLVGLFRRMGGKLPMRCLGEAVLAALGHAGEETKGLRGDSLAKRFAREFCDKVIEFERSMADQYPVPDGPAAPAAPLLLLQDLSVLMPRLPDLRVTMPTAEAFSHTSPLPLPLPILLHLGLIRLESDSMDSTTIDRIREACVDCDTPVDVPLAKLQSSGTARPTERARGIIQLSGRTYAALQTVSVEICRETWGAARFSRSDGHGGEWKHELSFLDIRRIYDELALAQDRKGGEISIVVSSDA